MIILLGLILIIGIIMIQISLSSKENKFLGLILPIINFIGSILIMALTCFSNSLSIGDFISYILILFLYNIPTLILLIIYYFSRKKVKLNSEIDKMNIQDLE